MSEEFEVFQIDDDFDPLTDLDIADPEDPENHSDYQLPACEKDADLRRKQSMADVPMEERFEKLADGLPGQRNRMLGVLDTCRDAKSAQQIADFLSVKFEGEVSVYTPSRLADLLEQCGCLESTTIIVEADDTACATNGTAADTVKAAIAEDSDGNDDVLTIDNANTQLVYQTTPEGISMLEDAHDLSHIESLLNEEPRYLPIYGKILEMAARDGGSTRQDYDAAIDPDPLLAEPHRYSGYFLKKLEAIDAIRYTTVWTATDTGRSALQSSTFLSKLSAESQYTAASTAQKPRTTIPSALCE